MPTVVLDFFSEILNNLVCVYIYSILKKLLGVIMCLKTGLGQGESTIKYTSLNKQELNELERVVELVDLEPGYKKFNDNGTLEAHLLWMNEQTDLEGLTLIGREFTKQNEGVLVQVPCNLSPVRLGEQKKNRI